MPLKRKLIKVGNSRAIVIPPDWIEVCEQRRGEPIEELLMEVNGEIILSVPDPDGNKIPV